MTGRRQRPGPLTWPRRGLIALGGAVGSLLRWSLQAVPSPADFPAGTLAANLIGTFLLGLAVGWLRPHRDEHAWLPITAGLLGATSTFSTFVVEVVDLAGTSLAVMSAYVLASIGAGLLLVEAGRRTGRQLAAAHAAAGSEGVHP